MSHPSNLLRVTSEAGLALIKASEGLKICAYPDPGNRETGEPWTIGYGHTRGVRPGDTCSEEQATVAVIQAEADARRMEFDTLQATLADVASARSQTVELAKAGSAIAWGAVGVSLLVTAAFMAALWFVVRQEIPAASREIAYILLGTLGAKFGDIVAYWVGSSSGSAQKSAALEKAVVTGGGR